MCCQISLTINSTCYHLFVFLEESLQIIGGRQNILFAISYGCSQFCHSESDILKVDRCLARCVRSLQGHEEELHLSKNYLSRPGQ